MDLWCPQSGHLAPLVKCFLSLGTGNPGKKPVEEKAWKFLSETLVDITTETEETARKFIERWRQAFESKRYFRLNVEQGLQEVGVAEYKDRAIIESETESYLNHMAQKSQVRACVGGLATKESVYIEKLA